MMEVIDQPKEALVLEEDLTVGDIHRVIKVLTIGMLVDIHLRSLDVHMISIQRHHQNMVSEHSILQT